VNGLECARQILEVTPTTRIVVLSGHTQEFRVKEALELGIRAYVLKSNTVDELLRSIEEVAHGRTYFSPQIAPIVADLVLDPCAFKSAARRSNPLTERERQVVTLIAEGNSTKEVAALLGISVKTADCHRTRIMDKLNLHQTATLVRYAIRQGFIEA
jgi:DNA-binding NarL/FixJ family response regulator